MRGGYQFENELNSEIKQWSDTRLKEMLFRIDSMGVRKRGELFRQLKLAYLNNSGEIEGIRFKMPRHGILQNLGFRHWKSGQLIAGRQWFSQSVTDSDISDLADIVAKHKANEYQQLIAQNIKVK